MMVVVAFGNEDAVGNPALRAMFRARKAVFADLLKWDVPVVGGEFEIDQFDNDNAVYIIVTDDHGNHQASARLLPTTRPHILSELFPHLCHSAFPRGPAVMEITRFCLDRRLNSKQRRSARNRLISAMVRFALGQAILTYTGVAEISWLQQILAFGWDCRPLGEPRHYKKRLLGALAIDIKANTPRLLAANGIWAPEPLSPTELRQAA